ncbi:MAG: response regulator [Desulfobacterales bacterium]|nr:response regulator [Desulfobacterales bacterium]
MAKTVILADDSKFLLKQLVNFFENEMHFEVKSTCNDGNEAVELYRKYRPDLITLDITMPNKDGEQAMKEIITEFPDANIIMITAVRDDRVLGCMNSGAKGYIEKPLKFSSADFVADFKETVNEIVRI